ncbi:hypothetical protein [Pedobacter sp. ASV28]|uniref:hypothetical protein n=1 Tax=Pedobacter sp. ASV28 TaxID=2795123 RepID=UPI0018EAE5D7|nr:hypothetical protein [Pedobacter sp. ASV28]
MKTKGQNKHFYSLMDKGIGDQNTVSSGPDNGANNNMGRAFWQCMRHSTTEMAVNNWLSRVNKAINPKDEIELFGNGNLNIGGHGNEGFLETGSGQTGAQDWKTNYITTWNELYWKTFLEKLKGKNFPIIYIYSCHSGAGERGADFLFLLAQAIGKPVAGRTGFTYSSNEPRVWFENGSVWQVATPDRRPTPINAPTPHFTKLKMITFNDGNVFKIITADQVEEVRISRNFINSNVGIRQLNVDNKLNKGILKDFFASEPFTIDGQFSAMKTGQVSVKVKFEKEIKTFVFDLYNDRIIGDQFGNYYYTNPNIYALIHTI